MRPCAACSRRCAGSAGGRVPPRPGRKARARQTAEGRGAAGAGPGPVAGGRVLRRLAPLTVRHLRHAAAGRLHLTDRARLAAAQDRIEAILGEVARDYGAQPKDTTV